MTDPQPVPQPVAPSRRYEIVDVLRGFALFGVLLSNVLWTTLDFPFEDEQRDALLTSAASAVVELASLQFVAFKFYTIFSILFGLGFAIQLERLRRRGAGALATYVRRLVVLILIGLAHSIFLWFGDILQFYGAIGLILILFRNRSDRFVLGSAIAIAVFVSAMPALHSLIGSAGGEADKAARLAAITDGSYLDIIAMHWRFQIETWSDTSLSQDGFAYWILSVLWKFLLGFWLGRRRVFQDTERYLPALRRGFKFVLALGLAGNGILIGGILVFDAWIPDAGLPVNLLWIAVEAGILSLSFAYMFALAILFAKPKARRFLQPLAPVGRMALTNYLTHSVLYLVLFYGIGFGWIGRMNAVHGLALSIAIFALQIFASRQWLRYFDFGPMEWLWRCLTYGLWIPIRTPAAETPSDGDPDRRPTDNDR